MSSAMVKFHLLLLLSSIPAVFLGNFSTESDNFYVAFPKSVFRYEVLRVIISNSHATAVPVFMTSLRSYARLVIVPPRSVAVMNAPSSFEIQGNSDYNKGLRVFPASLNKTVSVSIMKTALRSSLSGVYLVLPPFHYSNLQEYVYYITSYQWMNRIATINYTSTLLLVGAEADTSVILTPTQRLEIPIHFRNPSYNWTVVEGGESYSFKINKLETAHFENVIDLTGTKVTSNKPLTVIGSHECTDVPHNVGFCDAIMEQFPPTVTWGRFFLVMSLNSRRTGELYRIISMKDATHVKVKCSNRTGPEFGHVTLLLNRTGQVREFELGRDRHCSIMANKPVLVVQYSKGYSLDSVGDPFMAIIPPVQQYKTGIVMVKAPESFHSHISIFVPPEYYNYGRSIFINNTLISNWMPIFCGESFICGYGAKRSISVGIHKISHILPEGKFFVLSYGFEYHDGYGSSAGMEIKQIADICTHGDVRLTSANKSEVVEETSEGDVELCLNGVWSKICDSSSWTDADATVVCRQLLGSENIIGAMGFSEKFESNASWHHAIGGMHCLGSESKLLDCSWSKDDNVMNEIMECPYAMVKCYSNANITVTLSPTSSRPYYVRNPITLDCVTTITPAISTDLSLLITWRRNNQSLIQNTLNDTYKIQHPVQMVETSGSMQSQFKSSLIVPALKTDDEAQYDCLATIMLSSSGTPLVQPTLSSFNLNVNETSSVIFQLKLVGVGHCTNWLLQYDSPTEKGKEIAGQVVERILSTCSNCTITHQHITDAAFRCFSFTANDITFRARLYDTSDSFLPRMVRALEDWVTEGPSIAIKGVMVTMDPTCVLIIPSFAAPECVTSVWLETQSATTQDTTTHTTEASTVAPSDESQSSPFNTAEPQSSPFKTDEPQSSPFKTDEPQSSPFKNDEPQSSPFKTVPIVHTTTNSAIKDEIKDLCGSNQGDSIVTGSSFPYIIIAVALITAILIIAITTIIVALICVRYSKKPLNHGAMSTTSYLTTYDDPVEGRIHLATPASLLSKEPPLKLEIPPLDDPDFQDIPPRVEAVNPLHKEDISALLTSSASYRSQTPPLKLEIPHEDTFHCKRKEKSLKLSGSDMHITKSEKH